MTFRSLEIRRIPTEKEELAGVSQNVTVRRLVNVEVTYQSCSGAEAGYFAREKGGGQVASIEVYEDDQARIESDRIVIRGTLGKPDSDASEYGDWILTN